MFFLSWLTARGSGMGSACLITDTDSPVKTREGEMNHPCGVSSPASAQRCYEPAAQPPWLSKAALCHKTIKTSTMGMSELGQGALKMRAAEKGPVRIASGHKLPYSPTGWGQIPAPGSPLACSTGLHGQMGFVGQHNRKGAQSPSAEVLCFVLCRFALLLPLLLPLESRVNAKPLFKETGLLSLCF